MPLTEAMAKSLLRLRCYYGLRLLLNKCHIFSSANLISLKANIFFRCINIGKFHARLCNMQQWKIHREVRYKLDKLAFQTFVIDHLGNAFICLFAFRYYFDIFVYISVFFILLFPSVKNNKRLKSD